jgi:hypothetical protein
MLVVERAPQFARFRGGGGAGRCFDVEPMIGPQLQPARRSAKIGRLLSGRSNNGLLQVRRSSRHRGKLTRPMASLGGKSQDDFMNVQISS